MTDHDRPEDRPWTSYFVKCATHPRALSIARFQPRWLRNRLPELMELAPTPEMLTMPVPEYCGHYAAILANLDPFWVLKQIRGRILLCYEKKGDFCHRHVVAKWLYDTTGTIVKEWSFTGPVQVGPETWWNPEHPDQIGTTPPAPHRTEPADLFN